jgi:hypothetical protein
LGLSSSWALRFCVVDRSMQSNMRIPFRWGEDINFEFIDEV